MKGFDPQQMTLAAIEAVAAAAVQREDAMPPGPYVAERVDDSDKVANDPDWDCIDYFIKAADGTVVAVLSELELAGQAEHGRTNLNLRATAEQIAASINDAPLLGTLCLALLEKLRGYMELDRRIGALEQAMNRLV